MFEVGDTVRYNGTLQPGSGPVGEGIEENDVGNIVRVDPDKEYGKIFLVNIWRLGDTKFFYASEMEKLDDPEV